MILKTNHSKHSFIFLVFSFIILISSLLSFTAAWFTNTKMFKMGGYIPTIAVKFYNSTGFSDVDDSEPNQITYSLAKHNAGSYNTTPTISFKSMSTIDVYFRVKFTFEWEDSETYNLQDYPVANYIEFDLSDRFISADSSASNDNEKITSAYQWLYFKKNSSAVIIDATLYTILEGLTVSQNMPSALNITVVYQVVQANNAGVASFSANNTTLPTNWPVAS